MKNNFILWFNFNHMKIKYFLLCFCLFLISCDENNTAHRANFENKEENNKTSSVLIIGDDRSGSTAKNRKLNINDYKAIINQFNKSSFGTIAIRTIGNPQFESMEFYRVELYPELDLIKINEEGDPTLSERKIINKKNKVIKSQNDSINDVNTQAINYFLDTIENNVINYKKNGKDLTDINDFLSHLKDLYNELPEDKYSNIHIVIFSDGVHDANKSKVSPITFKDDVTLHLIGWKDQKIFTISEDKIRSYESKEGFLNAFKN